MTTIRKIVTSKIDGNSANTTDNNEIRPFGEIAFYLDTSGDDDQLTLMMFDGQRTHLKSKVLKQGVLFGSNADAGDGSGADTIKLIPDAELHNNGSDQYIVVDPTVGEPGHIHLRAGGTQDSSTADLFIGGELTCVRVSDTTDNILVRTTTLGDPNTTYEWEFDNLGGLSFPDNTRQTTAYKVVDVPSSSVGDTGDTEGCLAFDSNYMYYCTQDYVSNIFNVTAFASVPTTAWIDATDYPEDLAANFAGNPVGWTYNGVTITSVEVDNTYGLGYAIGAATSFNVVNGQDYPLVAASNLPDIWKRVAWSGDTW